MIIMFHIPFMVLRKYRYLAIKKKLDEDNSNTVIDKIQNIAQAQKGEKLSYKLVNMTLLDYLEDSKLFIIRVDRPASRDLVESIKNDENVFEVLFVSGIYKKLLKKVEIYLKGELVRCKQ
ncbi:hypothetical protein NBO_665g0002 [Nosema bombycis CQ1]|uniref:Uncharacterized protein n=1 Tax=Nosema bombycis (strain CQ1 / CVCC 102059) TaxID=578461 RepID=R0KP05_NOSB1|nr:hypothetical protein NBO_665g0002 [Nosema bombycis CQ1]|eukprot:EOB11897.1 hypothetical protein NBO_665g0002 [Nosema bombycis CQ1]